MTFALFILHVVLSYMHPGEIVPALAPYRIAYWVAMAGLAVAIGPLLTRRGGLLANLQLWVLIVFAAVIGLSLMVAERWLGAPVLAMQRFGPSLTIFVLAICSVRSLLKLRIAAGCVIVLTMTLMLQGAAAYHLGYNTQMFLLDRATRSEDPAAATAVDQADPPDDSVDEVSDDTDDTNDTAEDDEGREDPRIRGLGLMNDPNDLAMGMAVALGLIGGAWKARLQLRHLLLAAASGALVYGSYLTRSRGGRWRWRWCCGGSQPGASAASRRSCCCGARRRSDGARFWRRALAVHSPG